MAVNRYYQPQQHTFMPTMMNMYQNYYAQNAQAYENSELMIDSIYSDLAKVKAFGEKDNTVLHQKKQAYENKLNDIISMSKGKPMQLLPHLRELNREFVADASFGEIGQINQRYNVAATDYGDWKTRTAENKLDYFDSLTQKELIGTGQRVPDSFNIDKYLSENLSTKMAPNMNFNQMSDVAKGLLFSSPEVAGQGSRLKQLFGEDSDVYKSWAQNIDSKAKLAAVNKYDYTPKLEEYAKMSLSESAMTDILEEKGKTWQDMSDLALTNYLNDPSVSNHIQSLEQIYGAGKAHIEQAKTFFDSRAYAMWRETEASSGGKDNTFYKDKIRIESQPGKVYSIPDEGLNGENFRNQNPGMIKSMTEEYAKAIGIDDYEYKESEQGELIFRAPNEWPGTKEYDEAMKKPDDFMFRAPNKWGSAEEDKVRSDFKNYNARPIADAVSYGTNFIYDGQKISNFADKYIYDSENQQMGDFQNREMYIAKFGEKMKKTTGKDNSKELFKALGAEDEKQFKALMEEYRAEGKWHPIYWNGSEMMYNTFVFEMQDKNNENVTVAIKGDYGLSRKVENSFDPIIQAIGTNEAQKRHDFERGNKESRIIDYRGLGDYTVDAKTRDERYITLETNEGPMKLKTIDVKMTPGSKDEESGYTNWNQNLVLNLEDEKGNIQQKEVGDMYQFMETMIGNMIQSMPTEDMIRYFDLDTDVKNIKIK